MNKGKGVKILFSNNPHKKKSCDVKSLFRKYPSQRTGMLFLSVERPIQHYEMSIHFFLNTFGILLLASLFHMGNKTFVHFQRTYLPCISISTILLYF